MAGALLNMYTEPQVAFWIDGYFSVRPQDPAMKTAALAFVHAKQQAIDAMQRHIDEISAMSFERWQIMTECPSGKAGVSEHYVEDSRLQN